MLQSGWACWTLTTYAGTVQRYKQFCSLFVLFVFVLVQLILPSILSPSHDHTNYVIKRPAISSILHHIRQELIEFKRAVYMCIYANSNTKQRQLTSSSSS
jgi:hypothetical protein